MLSDLQLVHEKDKQIVTSDIYTYLHIGRSPGS